MPFTDFTKRNVTVALLVIFAVIALLTLSLLIVRAINVPETVKVRLGSTVFDARLADTPAKRERGLSGTTHLKADEAMLFVFDHDDKWALWMKGMNYPIDIVWLDHTKTVVQMARSVQPSTYPRQKFASTVPTRYVIELPAGSVDRSLVTIGSKAVFAVRGQQ